MWTLLILAGCVVQTDSAEVVAPRTATAARAVTPAEPVPVEDRPAAVLAAATSPTPPAVVAAAAPQAGPHAVALPPAPTVPRVGAACSQPVPARAPSPVRLSDLIAHARRVVAGHGPGAPICDPELLGTVQELVGRLAAATGRGELPFMPGSPRRPLASGRSSYMGRDPQLADADITLADGTLGHVERSLVVVDGNVRIGFLTDSIVIATGDADVAHADSSVIIAGGWLEVSHAGSQHGRGVGIPNVLVAGAWLRASFAYGAVLAAPDGIAIGHDRGSVRAVDPGPGGARAPGVVLSTATEGAAGAGLEVSVGPGAAPEACVSARGAARPFACGVEGQVLRDAGPVTGFTVLFSSPDFVTLARGAERVRRPAPRARPSRPELSAPLALPPGTEIHGLGLYESGTANARVPVALHRTAAPAVLVLEAYERVTWTLALDPGVRLSAVVLAGYHPSRVEGAPEGVPVLRAFEESGAPSTGASFYERSALETAARAALGPTAPLASYAGAERVGSFEIR